MIDLEATRGLLARAVLTQGPDFIYNLDGYSSTAARCEYNRREPGIYDVPFYEQTRRLEVKEGDPRSKTGCIVGVVFQLAGATLVPEMEGCSPARAAVLVGLKFADDATTYLSIAQGQQDAGASWGTAYTRAEEYVHSRSSTE